MPSFGMLVAVSIIISMLLLYSAKNDISAIQALHYSYNAYKNMQTMELYQIYTSKYVNSCNETCIGELQEATLISARMSGIQAFQNNCSIVLNTETYPKISSIITIGCNE